MSAILKVRNLFLKPSRVLLEATVKQGDSVLDFGCGPGDYSIAASRLVGEKGRVFSVDIHPKAAQKLTKLTKKLGLENVFPITTGCQTGLPSDSIDVVLLYYTLHLVDDPNAVLHELHRVLKLSGILSFAGPFHQSKNAICKIEKDGLFRIKQKNHETYTFVKDRS